MFKIYDKIKTNKRKGKADFEFFIVVGAVAVILIVAVPVIMQYMEDSISARRVADFSSVNNAIYNGIRDWEVDGDQAFDLNKKGVYRSDDEDYQDFYAIMQEAMPFENTIYEPLEGDSDESTWYMKIVGKGRSYDIYLFNGDYVSVNHGEPFLNRYLEEAK
ncbi:MAG: hypothetical protein ACK5LV_10910 [Lachnospirales bacterium]